MLNEIKVVKVQNEGRFVGYELQKLILPTDKLDTKGYLLQEGERLASFDLIKDTLRKLMGKTLTIIDASLMDTQQNKAVKDLIRNVYNEEMGFVAGLCFDQEVVQRDLPEYYEPKEEDLVEIDEILGVK